ncbi:hypothetical protein BJV77DRAFT_1071994 [Russula vinacea]|nr:hypothetical protein BJV77DRAFT_1071994 [Russula vinacea]
MSVPHETPCCYHPDRQGPDIIFGTVVRSTSTAIDDQTEVVRQAQGMARALSTRQTNYHK